MPIQEEAMKVSNGKEKMSDLLVGGVIWNSWWRQTGAHYDICLCTNCEQ